MPSTTSPERTVILANGEFPSHPVPLAALHQARRIVCCDGAAERLLASGLNPTAIVGDMDSLAADLRSQHQDIVHHDPGQNDNDLAKAFRHCITNQWTEITLIGATGKREDHTLGNLGWLLDFALHADVMMLTDHGSFRVVHDEARLDSHAGQQISFFTFNAQTILNADHLRYPMCELQPARWWQAALNEASAEHITLNTRGGPVLVFQSYP